MQLIMVQNGERGPKLAWGEQNSIWDGGSQVGDHCQGNGPIWQCHITNETKHMADRLPDFLP